MADKIPIDQLKKIVGEDGLEIHSEKVFISPENGSAASEIVKLANREKFKILPLGSGSIINPQKLAGDDFVVLKSGNLNKIKKVVPEDLYVILQAGFPLRELNYHLEPFNLFYPLGDAGSVGTMGGSVAANLKGKSGERSVQTREYMLALEIIDSEGQIVSVGARTFKSVTGYDLPRLFTGSWGTLGFISELTLRLIPDRKRKDYPSVVLDPPERGADKSQNDPRAVLNSRVKKALDPNGIFPNLESIS